MKDRSKYAWACSGNAESDGAAMLSIHRSLGSANTAVEDEVIRLQSLEETESIERVYEGGMVHAEVLFDMDKGRSAYIKVVRKLVS